MLGLKRYLSNHLLDLQAVSDGFKQGMKQQLVAGLTNAAKTLWFSSLYENNKESMVIVTHNLYQAQKIYDDLIELLNPEDVFLYPVNELITSEIATASPELRSQRIEVLNHLAHGKQGVIVTPVAGLRRLLPPMKRWKDSMLTFSMGDDIDLEALLIQLVSMGYERVDMVTAPGEFSVRGGIIDIYSLTNEEPIRIELFDTEVDSIRLFDSETQRSDKKLQSIDIGPARELMLSAEDFLKGSERLDQALADTLKKVKNKKMKETLMENISFEINQMKEYQFFQGITKYASLFYDKKTSLLDYLSPSNLIVFDEISRVQEMAEQLDKEEGEWYTALLEKCEIVQDLTLSFDWETILNGTRSPKLFMSLFLRHFPHTSPENIMNVTCRSMQDFHGQLHVLKTECDRWEKTDYAVVFLAVNNERAKRLLHVLEDYDIEAQIVEEKTAPMPGKRQIVVGDLNGGFELAQQKLVVLTEKEVFTKKVQKQKKRKQLSNAERLKSYNELNVGDYVVHVDHGIGKYIGIETLEVNGIHKDYLHIRYRGNDKLYVPVESIDLVQKYVASEGKEPKLYALGGSEWKRVKRKAKSSVEDIADELIELYAKREASVGHAFETDSPEQREFEQAFPYQETEDQLRAIEEIKKDMEIAKPMDRLLCGDVGYGKTEVALRAAFKAIIEGKQVAILVPTTILAQQHYETARERFSEFAVNTGVLSRFKSRKEQQETIKGIKKGTVDLVIGTHRILSKDITFKDLGLLIVDEEQRFGVTHKEKIKKMKANVDVLTLTATPIPRTLHMSMLGVRDLSVIETPPENRFPVQTYVAEYGGILVREAIERELARGGQIYFLYNRVETIERMAEQISMLVPDAKVAVAHGQMKENELESVMISFLEGEADVLVSTTIIETGVDIPNVNTLIVYDADRMGLSQLYQLRGRVGRSNRVAYAYFTYKKDKVMNEVAEKRLQAIKEFTELGSGFKIAMRDLSIRGAGNLLGAQQHGFIDSVGFDLYTQMLKDAIASKQGHSPEEGKQQVSIDIDLDAYIPDAYIPDSLQKIDMYKRFKAIENMKDIEELEDEMIDRFGDYPKEVSELCLIAKIKVMANDLGIESIKFQRDEFTTIFSEKGTEQIDRVHLFELVSSLGRHVGLGAEGNKIKLTYKSKSRILSVSEQTHEFILLFEKIYTGEKEKTKIG